MDAKMSEKEFTEKVIVFCKVVIFKFLMVFVKRQ